VNSILRGERGVVAVLVVLVFGAALVGCASARQRRLVSIRFQALHSCEAETVQSLESGYVITGCGIEAHYACLTNDPFPLLTGSRMRCVETYASDQTPVAERRPATIVQDHDEDGSLRLTASSSFPGGGITFVALPERFPDKAVVRLFVLRADATDDQHECAGDLWIDGERVTPHEATIEPVPGGALHSLLVDLSALDRMGPAQRVAARVCGVDVVIADPAGPLASQLAIRAREESSASRL
jgi:hypothetical protein